MTAPAAVHALAQVWGDWAKLSTFPYASDHCINGTRTAIEVLRRHGVKARPLSVRVLVFNQFAWDLYRAGVPTDAWPQHAHSIGTDQDHDDDVRFAGHLVAVGEGWLLDVSAGQLHRPGRIHSPGPLVLDFWQAPSVAFTDDHRQVWWYEATPNVNLWRHGSGWLRVDTDIIETADARLRQRQEAMS